MLKFWMLLGSWLMVGCLQQGEVSYEPAPSTNRITVVSCAAGSCKHFKVDTTCGCESKQFACVQCVNGDCSETAVIPLTPCKGTCSECFAQCHSLYDMSGASANNLLTFEFNYTCQN